MLGWLHAVQVGQRREFLVGETLGQLVHEAHQVARRRTLVLVHGLALGAGALRVVAVVLAHRDELHAGIGLEDAVNLGGHQFKYLGIGQAPLAVGTRVAHAVEEGVILGMSLAIDRCGQNLVKGVDPHVGSKDFFGLLESVEGHIVGVLGAVGLRLAITEGWRLGMVLSGNRDVVVWLYGPCIGGIVAHA